ncbi:LrgB family protein [Paenibacillus thermotolerans]|uniref:LrgB family protein n=1 Tax=Paenibacillus thermotolerans TaxID=3027807 RepID=UPI002367B259|nr:MULTISPECIES: LrgB family protein [unclassified Paenibacillus]
MADNGFLSLLHTPLFGITLTVALYAVSLGIGKRFAWLHPLFLTSGSIIALLLLMNIPYETYSIGGDMLTFLLGPATVALGVPLYKQRDVIRKRLLGMLGSITCGCAASIASGWLIMTAFGGSYEAMLATLPKSATSAITIEIARVIGGQPELTAVLTVLTGLSGSMMGPALLKLLRIDGDVPVGLAIGTAAHGIGTSRLLRDSAEAGAYSGLAMGIAGIVTALLMVPVVLWLL